MGIYFFDAACFGLSVLSIMGAVMMSLSRKLHDKQARESAGFNALVVDATTKEQTGSLISTGLRCFTRKCVGLIESEILSDSDDIHWYCTECEKEGFISSWHGTKWDNRQAIKPK